MRGWLGTTDGSWFRFLASQEGLDEVSLWFPSAGPFKALEPGDPFFFKLEAPDNAVGGFGVFARYSVLPLWLAWEAFGVGNGTPDALTLRELIGRYRKVPAREAGELPIGCAILTQRVLLPQSDRVRVPSDWRPNIVVGKGYDPTRGEGERVLRECLERAGGNRRPRLRPLPGAPHRAPRRLARPPGPRGPAVAPGARVPGLTAPGGRAARRARAAGRGARLDAWRPAA